MKIYFAASIRGGRDDIDIYAKLIAFLNQDNQVLTEHIGDPNLTSESQKHLTDSEIRNRDIAWLKEADLFIAETSNPSLGVGYELATAEKLGKPVIILHNPAKTKLSAMINGTEYYQQIFTYHTLSEALEILRKELSKY